MDHSLALEEEVSEVKQPPHQAERSLTNLLTIPTEDMDQVAAEQDHLWVIWRKKSMQKALTESFGS